MKRVYDRRKAQYIRKIDEAIEKLKTKLKLKKDKDKGQEWIDDEDAPDIKREDIIY
ncbi:MAG: hypothetical protein GXO10_04935 [Crenarchaeota archaeon]|nr:hypothetical protein [Thermoproteota archaeon]